MSTSLATFLSHTCNFLLSDLFLIPMSTSLATFLSHTCNFLLSDLFLIPSKTSTKKKLFSSSRSLMSSTYATIGTGAEKNGIPPGNPMSVEQQILDKGAQMLQYFKPINQMSQHACTFALYSHDMTRQIETHHFVTRLNQDFLQSAVYDTDDSNGRLIGVEYIISDTIFETLPPQEQKLWHSHAYEIKSGMWVHPRMPEMVVMPELKNLAKTYGKFWCTWQTDRGDKLPLGPPSLMMSPQAADYGVVKPELVKKRDDRYNISKDDLMKSRIEIPEPEWINPTADYWKQHKKCCKVDIESTEMKKLADFP